LNALAASGDRAAFAVLVARHEARLRGFLRRVAGPVDADDLAQDTFVRAWERAAQFGAGASYGAWLLRIGWHLFLCSSDRSTISGRSGGVRPIFRSGGSRSDQAMTWC
jgi:RNA polymerase sigma-70 factor (ECF subfamily)